MSKRKGKHQNEANFVSILPIEECARRLEHLRDDALQIELERLTSDTVDFTITLYERNRLRADGTGKLRRWEGTMTRVDVQVTVREGVVVWALWMTLMMSATLLLLPALFLMSVNVNPLQWLAVAGLGIVVIIGILFTTHRYAPFDDTPHDVVTIIEDSLKG